jgi:hypothetical protein
LYFLQVRLRHLSLFGGLLRLMLTFDRRHVCPDQTDFLYHGE